jgi:hypothetical protein
MLMGRLRVVIIVCFELREVGEAQSGVQDLSSW